jgi:hypothetical protein
LFLQTKIRRNIVHDLCSSEKKFSSPIWNMINMSAYNYKPGAGDLEVPGWMALEMKTIGP